MNKQSIGQKLGAFVNQELPDEVNLWPAILARVEALSRPQPPQQPSVRPPRAGFHLPVTRRYPKLALAMVMVVLALGLVVSIPSVRAAISVISKRFGVALVDTAQMRNTTSSVAPATTVGIPPSLNLEQAQRQVPFRIRTPTDLPRGLTLQRVSVLGATSSGGANTQNRQSAVFLSYGLSEKGADDNAPQIMLHITTRPEVAPVLLPKSREQTVMVNGQPAIYVHGGWRSDGQGDPRESLGDLRWDDNIDGAWLSWQDGPGVPTYMLAASGLNLSREDMIRIAESRD